MGSVLSGLAGLAHPITTGASYVFDPANLFGTRSSPHPSGPPGHGNWASQAGQAVAPAMNVIPPKPPGFVEGMLPAPTMGSPLPEAPPPPAHWQYDPHQGTSWMTPQKSGDQYNWNATAPGVAPGNRI